MRLRITELRKQRGLSQSELAAMLGISLSMMGKLERGERRMNYDWITKIANRLEVKEADLLDLLEPSDDTVHVGKLNKDGHFEKYPLDEYSDAGPADYDIDKQHWQSSAPRGIDVEFDLPFRLPTGSVIIYKPALELPGVEMVNRLAMIVLHDLDWPWVLGHILPGSEAGRFHVLMSNGGMLQNARLQGLMPVTEIRLP